MKPRRNFTSLFNNLTSQKPQEIHTHKIPHAFSNLLVWHSHLQLEKEFESGSDK